MKQKAFQGVATALYTPFKLNKINYYALDKQIEFQLINNVDAIVAVGSTAEPCSLSKTEYIELTKHIIKRVNGKVPVIVGSGKNDTKLSIEQSKLACDLGADCLLVVTPYYNKCTQHGLYLHYEKIANNCNVPIICYNVPSRTNVDITTSTMADLLLIENIVGIKDACNDLEKLQEMINTVKNNGWFYSGNDHLNAELFNLGANGAISVLSNIVPKSMKELFNLSQSGDIINANRLSDYLSPLYSMLELEVNPICIKAMANILGFDSGHMRLPLTDIEALHEKQIKETLNKLNLN